MNSGWWVAIVALVWLPIVARLAIDRRKRVHLRRSVFTNLDAAAENGYFEPDEQLHGMTADQIAYDMTVYASDFGDGDPVALTPYVCEWLREKGQT